MKGYATLKELGTIITGNTPKTSETENYDSNDIPFVKPSDLHESDIWELTSAENHISEKARGKARIAPSGTVLCTCIGIIGKIGIVSNECAFNQQINAIIPDTKKVIPHYLAYAISSKKNYMQEKANAAVVPIINKTQFGALSIQTPSLDKQRNIVNVLFSLEALISNRQQALSLLNTLVKSRFVEMFGDPVTNPMGWETGTLADVIRTKASNGFFAKRNSYKNDGNVAVLGVADVVNRMYSKTTGLPRTDATDLDIKKYRVEYGDVLFCRSSLVQAGIGKASIVPRDISENILFECHVIRLQLDMNKCIPEFIQLLTSTDYCRNQIMAESKTATMTTIGQEGILRTRIYVPPLKLQNEFLSFVALADKSKLTVQRSIDALQTLKAKLMQEYFG